MNDSDLIDRYCAIAHQAREDVRFTQETGITTEPFQRHFMRGMQSLTPWEQLTPDQKDQDRAAVAAVLASYPALGLLRYLAGAYERLLEAHDRVNMDTDEDRELHGRVIATFRKVFADLETAMERAGLPVLVTPRTLPDHEHLVDVLEREWLANAADKLEDSPRGHCERLARAVEQAAGFRTAGL